MCDFMLCLKPKKVNLEECFLFSFDRINQKEKENSASMNIESITYYLRSGTAGRDYAGLRRVEREFK